mmetsp:Transcript_102898/g.204236  ORF Transcript_102898/g.204236 Transcript_102898/m.204236 type:complete len:205 (-) Transcript_102898:291-905(-)
MQVADVPGRLTDRARQGYVLSIPSNFVHLELKHAHLQLPRPFVNLLVHLRLQHAQLVLPVSIAPGDLSLSHAQACFHPRHLLVHGVKFGSQRSCLVRSLPPASLQLGKPLVVNVEACSLFGFLQPFLKCAQHVIPTGHSRRVLLLRVTGVSAQATACGRGSALHCSWLACRRLGPNWFVNLCYTGGTRLRRSDGQGELVHVCLN